MRRNDYLRISIYVTNEAMVDFTYAELNADPGTGTADGLRNVANAAANFACSLYQNYAAAASGFPDPTGIGAFNNALYSRLCSGRPGYSAPTASPQFSGGQCPKLYTVTTVFNYQGSGGNKTSVKYNVPGPIKGVQAGASTSANRVAYGVYYTSSGGSDPGHYDLISGASYSDINPFNVVSFTVTPNDGVDNCGSPAPTFPVVNPPTTSITNNTTVNVGAGVTINAPISIVPVFNTANVNVNAQVQVKVGPFNVTFSAGGVNINPSFQFGPGGNQSPSAPALPPSSPSPTSPTTQCPDVNLSPVLTDTALIKSSLSTIKTELDDVKDCACPVTSTASTVSLGSGVDGYTPLPSNCIKVSLDIGTSPVNAKTQKSNGSEPTTYFCGYIYWGDGTGRTERHAVSFLQSVFYPPVWATAFGWNLYLGYSGSVTATKLVPSKSGAEFAGVQLKNPAK